MRDAYPTLVSHLAEALGRRRVLVAVPAFTDPASDDAAPFDLARLSRRGVGIVWMAYDQHDPTSEAGPVAGLPWVRDSLAAALRSVPPAQLLLGVPAYGYAWPARGQSGEAADLTVPEAAALAATARGPDGLRPGAGGVGRHDCPTGGPCGTTMPGRWPPGPGWPPTPTSGWPCGGSGPRPPGRSTRMGVAPAKHPPQLPGRPVRDVSGPGVVALTFDDGPDPTWTPRILAVLRREHVPATFFVIGQQAERYPRLLREEVEDGHVIGDHTYSHPDLSKTPDWRSRLEIDGPPGPSKGHRPPSGAVPLPYGNGDAAPDGKGSDQLAADLGFHPVGWTDDTDDWRQPGPGNIVDAALRQLSERTIVLLHDGGGPRR